MPAENKKSRSSRQFETIIAIIIVLAILATSILFHYKFYLLNFFFLPVIFSGYYLGKRRAVLIAITCILLEAFYLVFSRQVFRARFRLGQDEIILLISWAVFLFLTAWIVGLLSEKKQNEMINLKKAYMGILSIVLKYLEVGEEDKSRAEKISELAGKIAEILEMNKAEVENIKSAALLSDIEELPTCLPIFTQTAIIMEQGNLAQMQLSDREKVMLKTAALILSEIYPLLQSYYVHYRQKAGELEKSLAAIPLGASIIALSELYVKLSQQGKVKIGPEEISSLEDIKKLKGKYFPDKAVEALYLVVY
ncbi:MAG: hypothetical protein ACPLZD_10775 [Candidatus Saccharicenans sp.]|nr:MAG: hypothetical protein C0168_06925 [Candidatus Aminicenantes bacterium]HEK86004.1 hypothetical protein [Candidatus Aminicenantes bacterium]